PRYVQVLERQAERLHALLEEMLEVSRIETGRFLLHQEPCEVNELVEASRRSLRRLGADADVEAHLEAGLPLVADRERIERALTAMVLRARALGRTGGGEGRVLVVDDDEPIARMMAEFLAEHGFEADWAGGGRLALIKIKADPPDALVLDLRMPDMDGRALLTALRAEGL